MDKLIVNGFPKSSNNYLYSSLTTLYPSKKINTPMHSIHLLKNSFGIISPIRNPVDSVSSFFFHQRYMGDNDKARQLLHWYKEFYEAILEKEKIVVLRFKDILSDVRYCVSQVIGTPEVDVTPEELLNAYKNRVDSTFHLEMSEPFISPHDRDYKKQNIADAKDILLDYNELLSECVLIYKEVKNYKIRYKMN